MDSSLKLATPAGPSQVEPDSPAWKRMLPVVIIVALLALAGWGIANWMGQGSGKAAGRQTVKIAVLPDAPPPPPPPPKEEKKPEPPKEEPKQTMQAEQPKVAPAPPAPAQLNMAGPAGDGPSAFGAGSVNNDYNGGPVGSGTAASAPASANDRAKFNFYAKSITQMLRSELDRSLPRDVIRLGARLQIWVDANGQISRYEVRGLSDKEAEDRVRTALDSASKVVRLAPPAGLPQPVNVRLSVDPLNG